MSEEEQKYFKGLIGFKFDSDDIKYIEKIVDKKDKEIERLNKELEDRNSINLACYMLRDDNRELYSQLEKLKSIIKEARELLNQEWYSVLRKGTITKVKEILDKVEENTNGKD